MARTRLLNLEERCGCAACERPCGCDRAWGRGFQRPLLTGVLESVGVGDGADEWGRDLDAADQDHRALQRHRASCHEGGDEVTCQTRDDVVLARAAVRLLDAEGQHRTERGTRAGEGMLQLG